MKIRFVILAAGKGSRMGADVPKALVPVAGKPILQHLIESVNESEIDGVPIIVIGHERTKLCEAFGEVCEYVVQEEQLGTGHAVMVTKDAVGDADAIIVLYGDHPFVSAGKLKELAVLHEGSNDVMTMVTTKVPSFDDWHSIYSHWGRIIRDTHGHVVGIKEYKDAMDSERDILEINPALYCFDTKWLWENISQLKNINASEEFYLTDLVALAVAQGHEINSMSIDPEEAIGVNTKEERDVAERIYPELNR